MTAGPVTVSCPMVEVLARRTGLTWDRSRDRKVILDCQVLLVLLDLSQQLLDRRVAQAYVG